MALLASSWPKIFQLMLATVLQYSRNDQSKDRKITNDIGRNDNSADKGGVIGSYNLVTINQR